MKRMRKLLLFLAALQVVNTVSGIVLKSRFLSQHIGEGVRWYPKTRQLAKRESSS